MSTYDELITTLQYVRDRTGDANAWQTGLAPDEVAAVIIPTTPPARLDAIVRKIRQQHANLFGPPAPTAPSTGPPPVEPDSGRDHGEAAEAMAGAEAALAHQNSASSQLDMQVISAILNAHLTAVDGRDALAKLQRETETAVLTRSDLDTPAGARDFQRFLIGKLRDIRSVVLSASLDDTSKAALMAAWTSLYDASKSGPNDPGDRPSAAVVPAGGQPATDDAGTGWDPLLDPISAEDPGPPVEDSSGRAPSPGVTPAAMPAAPMMPAIPGFGAGSMPGLGSAPGSGGGWGGLPLPGLREGGATDPAPRRLDDELPPESHDAHRGDHAASADDGSEPQSDDPPKAESPPHPTAVTLPDGETVTAPNAQLAAVIQAAIAGSSISDAFHQQGIAIPAPGTPVTNPIEQREVATGDVGVFTDRHALALSREKALLDGQIQPIAVVSGPNFLGWEHPPAPVAPAKPDAPTPTRPAGMSRT